MQVFFIPNDGIPLPVQKALSLDPQTPAAFGQYLYIRTNSGQCVQVENTPEGDAMMKLLVPEGVADSHTPVIEQTLFQLMIGSTHLYPIRAPVTCLSLMLKTSRVPPLLKIYVRSLKQKAVQTMYS